MLRDRALCNKVANAVYCVSAFLLFLSFLPLVCAAQSQPTSASQTGSSRLDSITVTGSGRFSSGQIAAITGLHTGAGSTVTRDDLQNAANRLSQLGPFATVQYRFATSGTDVKLEFQVTDAPALPVTFDNFPWFSDDEIAQALKTSVVLFDGTVPEHGTILDEMSAALEKLLSAKGIQAGVSHQVVTDSGGDRLVQQFRAEGVDLTIDAVNFSDPLASNDRTIQSSLANLVGSPFSRTAIELFEFEHVRPVYLAHGFLRVRFAPPVAHLEAAPPNTAPSRVAIVAAVDPGPALTWNGVTWTGNSAIRSTQLDTTMSLKPGDLADGTKIEAAWDRARPLWPRWLPGHETRRCAAIRGRRETRCVRGYDYGRAAVPHGKSDYFGPFHRRRAAHSRRVENSLGLFIRQGRL
jgi:outer membrane protein assembly factor BamA